MRLRLTTRPLPQRFREPTREMCRRILKHYPSTTAFVVIGSVATGTWEEDSDLDLVWVFRGRLRREWHDELDYWYEGPVELVPFNLSQVRKHFRLHSPMGTCDPTGNRPLRPRRAARPVAPAQVGTAQTAAVRPGSKVRGRAGGESERRRAVKPPVA